MLLAILFAALQPRCGLDLCSREALEQYAAVFAASRFGAGDTEKGAFLVRGRSGKLGTVMWESAGHRWTSYNGVLPRGVIAVVHTHPGNDMLPSSQDLREARRLKMPIIVLTRSAITAGWPDGATTFVRGQKWIR